VQSSQGVPAFQAAVAEVNGHDCLGVHLRHLASQGCASSGDRGFGFEFLTQQQCLIPQELHVDAHCGLLPSRQSD
jgi:hypothetical protein